MCKRMQFRPGHSCVTWVPPPNSVAPHRIACQAGSHWPSEGSYQSKLMLVGYYIGAVTRSIFREPPITQDRASCASNTDGCRFESYNWGAPRDLHQEQSCSHRTIPKPAMPGWVVGGLGGSAGPAMQPPPSPPRGLRQQSVAKGTGLWSPWALKSPNRPWAPKAPEGKFCPLCTTTLTFTPMVTLTPTPSLVLALTKTENWDSQVGDGISLQSLQSLQLLQ